MQTKLYVDPIMWAEVMHMVMLSDVEISFMCDLKYVDGLPYVYAWHLPKQTNTSTTTEMDAESVGQIPIPIGGYTNVWIHSHVDMKAFWSGTDSDTSEQLGKHGFMYSIVVNRKHEYKCCYLQGGDAFYPPMYRDDIPIVVGAPISKERELELDELVKQTCTKKEISLPLSTYDISRKADVLTKKEIRELRKDLDYQISNVDLQVNWENYQSFWDIENASPTVRAQVLDEYHNELLQDNFVIPSAHQQERGYL